MKRFAQLLQDRCEDVENHKDGEQPDEAMPAEEAIRLQLRVHSASYIVWGRSRLRQVAASAARNRVRPGSFLATARHLDEILNRSAVCSNAFRSSPSRGCITYALARS
jgi:hypothetical protein